MNKVFELYFNDLTDEAKERLLKASGINDPKEGNWDMDILPIALIPLQNDAEYCDNDVTE